MKWRKREERPPVVAVVALKAKVRMEYVCPSDATEEEQSILLPASNWNGIFFICFVFILFFILENCFEWRLPPHVLPNAPQVKKKRMKKKKREREGEKEKEKEK